MKKPLLLINKSSTTKAQQPNSTTTLATVTTNSMIFRRPFSTMNVPYEDTRTNLALARSKTSDKVTPPSEMFFITWWKDLCNSLSINTWTTMAVVGFVLMLLGILAYMFLSNLTFRKIGIYSAIVLFFAVVLANLCALSQHLMTRSHTDGIIFKSAVTVKSSPSESSTDLFIVHAGSKVEILDNTMQDWLEVKLEEGKQGWIPSNTLEVI